MPPKEKGTVGKAVETVDAPVLGADPPQAHDSAVLVEQSDVKDQPIKTSGAVPPTVVTADGIDEAATTATVMIDHPVYGRISLADLEEVIRADADAKYSTARANEQAQRDENAEKPCEKCFPEGWDSANAVNQDGVGCEHGSWSKTKTRGEVRFPDSWKSGEPKLAKE